MNRNRLGEAIHSARLAKGLSLRSASELAGVNHETWRRAELGDHVKDDNLSAICQVMELGFEGVEILISSDKAQPLPDVPEHRRAVAVRALDLLPRMTDKQIDGLIGILDLWELQLSPKRGE